MVKGTTRQVIWIKGSGEKLFEQAIFLVKENMIEKGGVTEDELLKEAKRVCSHPAYKHTVITKLLWAISGAAVTGFFWILTAIF